MLALKGGIRSLFEQRTTRASFLRGRELGWMTTSWPARTPSMALC